jgi:hypothetical protein
MVNTSGITQTCKHCGVLVHPQETHPCEALCQEHGGCGAKATCLTCQQSTNEEVATWARSVSDREALVAWGANKTVQDPDQSSPKWPNQITRRLAQILLSVSNRLDVDRVLIEGHENIVRNLSARVQELEVRAQAKVQWNPLDHPLRGSSQRLVADAIDAVACADRTTLDLFRRVHVDTIEPRTGRDTEARSTNLDHPSTDPTTAALNRQADKVSEALQRAEYYELQFNNALAQRDEAIAERDAARTAIAAARRMLEES